MKKKNNKMRPFITFILFFAFFGFFVTVFEEPVDSEKAKSIPYYEMVELIEENKEKNLKIKETSMGEVTLMIEDKEDYVTLVNPRNNSINDLIVANKIEYEFVLETNYWAIILQLIFWFFIIGVLMIIVAPMLKRNKGTSKTIKSSNEGVKISFKDIGGLSREVKNEINQAEKILRNPSKAKKLGIKPPKGILLYGPSGTGKTLIAKALANSFNAQFISAEGSSFVEMFAGMGAKRVRDLFEKAKKNAPSVIFIDEIDSIGKKRGNGLNHGGTDEREQTLNQLLVLMDGIEENKEIFIVAATNRIDILDPALLRPGRFDYKIKIDLPDLEGRKEIMEIHKKNIPLSEEVVERIEEIAHSIVGYSGAEIESLFKVAANNAFNNEKEIVDMEDINHAIDRIIVGSAGRKINDMETKRRVACHEAGHALIASLTVPNSVRKVTIIPRGQALGYVAQVPTEELLNDLQLFDRLKVMVAGGVAEKEVFGNHSMGVGDDFKKAKELVEKMVEDLGMGKNKLIPTFSEKEKLEQSKEIYSRAVKEVRAMLQKNNELFEEVVSLLLEKETIDGREVEELIKINNKDKGLLNLAKEKEE